MKTGDKFSVAFSVNQKIYNGFIELFKDKNPLHTDTSFAQSKGFKGAVMFGNILNGFLSYFIGECLPVKNVIIHLQEIKYIKPVFLDDELMLKAEIVEFFESVNTYEIKYHFENNDNQKVARGKIQIGII